MTAQLKLLSGSIGVSLQLNPPEIFLVLFSPMSSSSLKSVVQGFYNNYHYFKTVIFGTCTWIEFENVISWAKFPRFDRNFKIKLFLTFKSNASFKLVGWCVLMVKSYSFEPCKHVLLEGLHVLPFSLCGFPPTLQPQASVRRLETLGLLFPSPLPTDWQLKDMDSYQPQPTRGEMRVCFG